jgi:selT/selW/selH-like putative selenoprotein
MQKYFLELKRFVESNYPEFQGNIAGEVYPPPWHAIMIANIMGYVWLAGIVAIFMGSSVLQSLSIPEPPFMVWISQNKIQTFMILFVCNNMANSLLATGAFEVYVDDELAFSKLLQKRFPSSHDIVAALAERGFRI